MTVYEKAQSYFPRLWDKSRLEQLVAVGKLTQEEMDQIINENEEAL